MQKGDALIGNSDPDFTDFVIDKIDSDAYRFMPFRSPAGADLYDYAEKARSGEKKVSSEGGAAGAWQAGAGLSAPISRIFLPFCLPPGKSTTPQIPIAMSLYRLAPTRPFWTSFSPDKCWGRPRGDSSFASPPGTMLFPGHPPPNPRLGGHKARAGRSVVRNGEAARECFDRPHDAGSTGRPTPTPPLLARGAAFLPWHVAGAPMETALFSSCCPKKGWGPHMLGEPEPTRSNFICG
ncbi:MAG: hypothetical protein CM15mP115_19510 [Alphaproteobacteria bacterium]|nr:MAG: hypothetical protein CM15mP115_19510 [Alphaproteobacteria bacterium]